MKPIIPMIAAMWLSLCASALAQTADVQFDELKRQVDSLRREVDSLKSKEGGGVTIKFKDAGLKIYGFLTLQDDRDTTQSLFEAQGNTLLSKRGMTKVSASGEVQNIADNYAGQHGREILSPRYSRLDFAPTLPKTDSGLASSGLVEVDFLGNDAPNTNPGATPAAQTENNYFNFGAVRIRHAYINLDYDELNFKFGQTWSPFAWTDAYDQPEITVQPTVGKAQQRIAQARLTHTHAFADRLQFQSYAGYTRPPAMNSDMGAYHFGARASSLERKAYEPSTSGGGMAPLSAAVSVEFLPVRTVAGNALGDAEAAAAFIPVIASKDGKDRANTLGVGGDYVIGSGLGATEYPGLTMGVPGVTAAQGGAAVDQGIAGVNQAGNLELIRIRTWRAWGVYSPLKKLTVGGGYVDVQGRNLDRFTPTASTTANWTGTLVGIAPRLQYYYGTVIYDPAPWLRFAGELAQTRNIYNDPQNRFAVNNRLQLSVYLFF